MAGSTALTNRDRFGWKSHSIISVEFGSSDISCTKSTAFQTDAVWRVARAVPTECKPSTYVSRNPTNQDLTASVEIL